MIARLLAAALVFVLFTDATTSRWSHRSDDHDVDPDHHHDRNRASNRPTDPHSSCPRRSSGSWVSTDGAATASFSETELQTLEADLPRRTLRWPSVTLAGPPELDRVPTAATPSSTVLTLELELNGSSRRSDAVAVLAPTDECLSRRHRSRGRLSDFDLLGDDPACRSSCVSCPVREPAGS